MADSDFHPTGAWPARCAAIGVFLIGLGVWLSWKWPSVSPTNIGQNLPVTAPATAFYLILSGLSLWLVARDPRLNTNRIWSRLGYGGGLVVAMAGALALVEHVFKIQLPVNSWPVPTSDILGPSPVPNRPSFLTALNLLCLGLALALVDVRPTTGRWRIDVLLVVPAVISLLAVIGYACGVPSFYGRTSLFPNTAMSWQTVLACILLGTGLLGARPHEGIARLIRSPTAGGVVARRLLLAPVLIPLGTGLATMASAKVGIYNAEFAGWLIAFLNILIFTMAIWWIATLLEREGEVRDAAERSVHEANLELEQRVQERTGELREAAERAQWLASFPERNPNPIVEVSLVDGTISYMNPFAYRLLPDLRKLGLQHPWLAGLQQHIGTLHSAESPPVRREITVGKAAYAQTITYAKERQLVRVYATDITERKQADEALTRERNLLRALIDHLPACIYVKDLEGRFQVYNAASVELTGVGSEAAALGKTVFDLFPEEIARLYEQDDRKVLESGEPVLDREEPTQDKDQEQGWFLTTKIPLRDERGIIGLLGISQDITQRKEAEQLIRDAVEREQALRIQAQQSEDRFRTLVERSLVGIYVIQEERFAYVNPAMEKILGYSTEEIATLKVIDTVLPEDRGMVQENLRLRLQGRVAEARYGMRLLRRNGSVAFVEVSGSVSEFNGRPAILGTLLDITERREAEQRIHQLNEELEGRVRQRTTQLEEANKELEAFSYSVSHDLRAPLRHIHGYGELLKREIEGKVNEDAERFLQVIIRASGEMGQLIDDLLAFSRMARVELREKKVDLNDLVRETWRGLEMAAEGREITWNIGPLPPVVGDPAALKQVWANLLGNSIKYTRQRARAEIEIGCQGVKDGQLVFYVRDNGAGFDMRYADKLFGVFQRLHRADEFEGTGIGLATVRRIVQRHGGRTWAEGVVDQGATFYFTLKPDESTLLLEK